MGERVVAQIGGHKGCTVWATWNWHLNRSPGRTWRARKWVKS